MLNLWICLWSTSIQNIECQTPSLLTSNLELNVYFIWPPCCFSLLKNFTEVTYFFTDFVAPTSQVPIVHVADGRKWKGTKGKWCLVPICSYQILWKRKLNDWFKSYVKAGSDTGHNATMSPSFLWKKAEANKGQNLVPLLLTKQCSTTSSSGLTGSVLIQLQSILVLVYLTCTAIILYLGFSFHQVSEWLPLY
jgi:hypothetical protein